MFYKGKLFKKSIILHNKGILLVLVIIMIMFYLWNKFNLSKRIKLKQEKHSELSKQLLEDKIYIPALPNVNHIRYTGATIKLPGGSKQFFMMANNRRSVRTFKKFPKPPIDVVEYCIRAAGTAPSGAHTEPWTFCLIQDSNIKSQIRNIVEAEEYINYTRRMHKQWTTDLIPLKTNHVKAYLTDAPFLILVFKQTYGFAKNGMRKQHYYNEISVSIAVGILLSALQAAGVNSLVTTPLYCGAALRDLLSRPHNEKLLVLLPIGYSDDQCMVPDFKRKDLRDIMYVY